MPNITAFTKRDGLWLLLILLVASVLRFGEPGIVEYFHDDAMVTTLAQEMVAGERFPVTGIISSTGIPNPPTSIYVMAIPFALSSQPMVAVLFIMGLNVLGVGLLWGLSHRYFGRIIGLVAGLAYGVSPWAVFYSRKIWAQDFHTPFILLGLWLGIYGFWKASTRAEAEGWSRHHIAQMLCLPILLFGMQIHFAAWALLPLYLLLLWQGRDHVSWRALGLSLLLSVLVMMPYAIGLQQTLEQDPNRISDAASRSSEGGLSIAIEAWEDTFNNATGLGLETWVAPDQIESIQQTIPRLDLAWWVLGGLAVLGGIWLIHKRHRFVGLILLWALLPSVLLTPTWTEVFPHYFVASIPAVMVLIGLGFTWLREVVPKANLIRPILVVGLVLIWLSQVIWWRGLLSYLNTTEVSYPGFTTPLHYLESIRDELLQYEDIVVVSHGMAWNLHHEVAVWETLLAGEFECVRTLQGDGYAVFPEHEFAVMIAPDAPENAIDNLYIKDEPSLFPVREDGGEYRIYTFESAPEWDGETIQSIEPVLFDNGVRLIGYGLSENRVVLQWRLPAEAKGLDYQYTSQLLTADGEREGQYDAPFWHGRHWCADDVLLTWGNVNIPEEATTLRVGMYILGTGKDAGQYFSADVLDVMGNATGQFVDIDLKVTSEE